MEYGIRFSTDFSSGATLWNLNTFFSRTEKSNLSCICSTLSTFFAVQEFERKETAKFHKIYESLQDLCSKQFKLEENVASMEADMRAQFMPFMSNMGMPMVMCAPQMMQQMQYQMPMFPMQQAYKSPETSETSDVQEVQTERTERTESLTERTESTEAETPTMKDAEKLEKKDLKDLKA